MDPGPQDPAPLQREETRARMQQETRSVPWTCTAATMHAATRAKVGRIGATRLENEAGRAECNVVARFLLHLCFINEIG